MRYTNEQVEALERVYHECPKPSSIRRHQLIKECPILQNIEPKQIKVWFQNRRYDFSAFRLFSRKFCIHVRTPTVCNFLQKLLTWIEQHHVVVTVHVSTFLVRLIELIARYLEVYWILICCGSCFTVPSLHCIREQFTCAIYEIEWYKVHCVNVLL